MADETSPATPQATPQATVREPDSLEAGADLASRRRARRWVWVLVAVVFVGIIAMLSVSRRSSTSNIEAPKAFCRAAHAYEKELGRQARRYRIDTPRQIAKVEAIAASAPPAIRDDAERFLASLRAVDAATTKAQRRALQDDPEVIRAVENVNRYWNQGCGVFDRQGGI